MGQILTMHSTKARNASMHGTKCHQARASPQYCVRTVLVIAVLGNILDNAFAQAYANAVRFIQLTASMWPQATVRVYVSQKMPHSLQNTLYNEGADVFVLRKDPLSIESCGFSSKLAFENTINVCFYPCDVSSDAAKSLLELANAKKNECEQRYIKQW